MLRLYAPNLHFAGELVDSIWSLRVWQRPSSADPTIKPVMFRVREVNRVRRIMTSTFLGWVAYQLSSHRLSALTRSPETPGNLLSEVEGLNNITFTKSCMSCVLNTVHYYSSGCFGAISVSECCQLCKASSWASLLPVVTLSHLKCERHQNSKEATTTNSRGISWSPS